MKRKIDCLDTSCPELASEVAVTSPPATEMSDARGRSSPQGTDSTYDEPSSASSDDFSLPQPPSSPLFKDLLTPPDVPRPAAFRARTRLPVPVPNLTKKSRGRRVPTFAASRSESKGQSEQRTWICSVKGCGKCFQRSEHLKRHIRSIHTHEKPFRCTAPGCERLFNRKDNLLQHLKVHRQEIREYQPFDAADVTALDHSLHHVNDDHHEYTQNDYAFLPSLTPYPPPFYELGASLDAAAPEHGTSAMPAYDEGHFSSYQAVSDVRTEIPMSPPPHYHPLSHLPANSPSSSIPSVSYHVRSLSDETSASEASQVSPIQQSPCQPSYPSNHSIYSPPSHPPPFLSPSYLDVGGNLW